MAYDTFLVRLFLAKRKIKAQIPKKAKKKRLGTAASSRDKEAYKKNRSSVERFFDG